MNNNENEGLISVIVPIFNVESFLERCVNSIINQTYKNIEIILVDDGSTDSSPKICDNLAEKDNRIVVIHQENNGVSSARNNGLNIAKGNYITFIDSDDYVEENYLEAMINKLLQKKVNVIACQSNKVFSNSIEKSNLANDYELSPETFVKWLFLQKGVGICRGKIYKKEVISNIRFDEKLHIGEDTYFNLLVSQNMNKFYMMHDSLYNYVVNNESLVRKPNEKYVQRCLDSVKATYMYTNQKYSNNSEIITLVNNYTVFLLTLIIVNYCCNSRRGLKISEEIKEIKKVCNIPEFKKALKEMKLKYFSISRKIMIVTIKCKMLLFTALIGNIRQKQINKGK